MWLVDYVQSTFCTETISNIIDYLVSIPRRSPFNVMIQNSIKNILVTKMKMI